MRRGVKDGAACEPYFRQPDPRLPFTIPMFIIEQNDFLDRYLGFTGHMDIDYDSYDDVAGNYISVRKALRR